LEACDLWENSRTKLLARAKERNRNFRDISEKDIKEREERARMKEQ
jgi:hypothetical protein